MANIVVGIVAHVDAGKTTLSEALLYRSGALRTVGRVDNGNAFLDTDALEKKRGITIFPHEAVLPGSNGKITLLDTPGHADFAASAESVLPVLDAAVLVVSAADGIQGSTRLLWRLLDRFHVPVAVFLNKCDLASADPAHVLKSLQSEFSPQIVPFVLLPHTNNAQKALHGKTVGAEAKDPAASIPQASIEQMASADDALVDAYLRTGKLTQKQIRQLVASRKAFPTFFGSALKMTGIDALLDALTRWFVPRLPADAAQHAFSARVFRISHEGSERLTWLRVMSGTLAAKQEILPGQKADQIRFYDGSHFTTVQEAESGQVATITGLASTRAGQGIGTASSSLLVQPVLESSVEAPGTDSRRLEHALRQLADEEPLLDPRWQGRGSAARLEVCLMGDLEEQILLSELASRFGITARFGTPRILYTETISRPVEGVGHFEPLRHYAEVHVRLDPAPRGSGIAVHSALSTDELAASWQHQILSRLATHTPVGVLTGSPLTDVVITLVAGRASTVHTVGGDFRQAADRAVRMGLMRLRGADGRCGDDVLLQPWQDFRLELPESFVGRAMNDLQRRGGEVRLDRAPGRQAVLEGCAPAAGFRGYARQARIYSHGQSSLELTPAGSRPVANPEPVIRQIGYNPVADLDNPPGSIFCAHGAGYPVAWNRVPDIMHLPWAETDLLAPHHQ